MIKIINYMIFKFLAKKKYLKKLYIYKNYNFCILN